MRAAIVGIVAVLLAASGAAPLRAQERLVDGIGDASAREAIRASIAQAEARGVPSAPLLTKVREGLAKQAPAPRIAQAVGALATRLASANDALAAATSADEVAAGAGALQAGISAASLRELRTRWPGTPLTVALGVMTQLVASGVPVPRAVSQVRVLLERGATPAQLVAFTAAVQSDVAAGIAPDVALMLRIQGGGSIGALGTGTTLGNTIPPAAPPPPAHPRP
jgi:hypothetical protein